MTNELIIEYGLAEHLDVFVSDTFVSQACRSMMAFAETHAAATCCFTSSFIIYVQADSHLGLLMLCAEAQQSHPCSFGAVPHS